MKPLWVAQSGPVVVSVDPQTFRYSIAVGNHSWLTDGQAAVHCGGFRYCSAAGNLTGGAISVVKGTHPRLGPFDAIQRTWHAGACTEMMTSVRQYAEGGVEFLTTLSAKGAAGTATETQALPVKSGTRLATEFPSMALPSDSHAPGLLTFHGNSLAGMGQHLPQPADWSHFLGGLEGGPLILYSEEGGRAQRGRIISAVLGASGQFKVAAITRVGSRLVAGAQGMITSLPPHYTVRFALTGKDGLTSSMMGFGALLRRAFGTNSTKLRLADDVLSRQLHYVNDGGSLLNYCDYWPQCVHSSARQFPDGPVGCTPMAFTLAKVSAYHRSLGLHVGVYHVDPFWFSQLPLGGCLGGAMATNLSASPWSFPDGLRALGIRLMLFVEVPACMPPLTLAAPCPPASPDASRAHLSSLTRHRALPSYGRQGFTSDNVYQASAGGGYAWAGASVAGSDSARFFSDRFAELTTGRSQCSALTLDGLPDIFYSSWSDSSTRYTDVSEQATYDRGLADAALAHKLPIRVDSEIPSDVLASVEYGARTVARCTGDATPCAGKDPTGPWAPSPKPCRADDRWRQLAGSALLYRAMGLRPFTDVLWTTSVQTGDPRWGAGAKRPTPVHDLVVATLTAGPVGFGDLVNQTNATLLASATRLDGSLLKPASTALRIDRFYRAPPHGGAEVWAAVTGPAGSANSATDDRANSMAALGEPEAEAKGDALWWWSLLSTDVDGGVPSGAPLELSELWPTPPLGKSFLVATVLATAAAATQPTRPRTCVHGALAASCLQLWTEAHPLPVGTSGVPSVETKNFTLALAAPVLSSGWALLGELDKIVPCSPQRFVAPSSAGAPRDADLTAGDEVGLAFRVLGSPGESVAVTVVAPPLHMAASPIDGRLIVLELTVPSSGEARVECTNAPASCAQRHELRAHDLHARR